MTDKKPIVVMKGITIEFPGVKALDGVDLRLFPGEVHALMGENGAGKSTMIKALTGVYQINAGTIEVDGKPCRFGGTLDAQNAGIATVYQEVNLCTNLSVGENVMLGHEVRGPLGINWKKTHEEAKKFLAQMGLHVNPHAPLSSISIAMQQLVAIARAMVIDAKVLILDEPTSSLDANEVQDLYKIMRKVRDSGVAILFVSHFLDQIYEICDRMTILRNGRFIKEVMVKDTPRNELIGMMIGKSAEELSQIGAKKARRAVDAGEKPIVSIKQLGKKGTINPVDLDIYGGEVVGFAGLLGSGRTELGRLLYGADKPDTGGSYELKGKTVSISDPYTALKNKIAYSTENRRDEGIIGDLTVRQNMLIALQATRGMLKPIPKKEADEIVAKYMKELNVQPPDPDRPIKNLSGGNQQKVLIGRWLATHPDLLILDEPTRGIDIGAKAEIQQVVLDLAEQGMGVVFISSELEEVVRLSDNIEVLKDRHKIAEIENGDTVSQQTIVDTISNTTISTGKEA